MTRVNEGNVEQNTPSSSTRSPTRREVAVVELVARFRQLRAGQIGEILFSDNTSPTPLKRTLGWLVASGHLARLERPRGGDGGGSAQYAYYLGRVGWRMMGRSSKSYWAPTTPGLHTLDVADLYIKAVQAARGGAFEVLDFTPEPECHKVVGNIHLTPDAFMSLDFDQQGSSEVYDYWLELDRATEDDDDIIGKCQRYWHAFSHGHWPDDEPFPLVLFVVPNDRRKAQIEDCIKRGPDEAHDLFGICLMDDFPASL